KMPNTRSGASMTHEEVEELVTRRVAEEMEAREAAGTLEPLNENGDEQEGEDGGNGNGELVLPRDELVLLSQQLVLLEENSSYCSRLQLPVLNQLVNNARITVVGEKVNAAESLLVVSTKVNAN
ncbi:hypothetical protein Tco_0986931, partial [Tanacetum coccineum]